MRVPHQRHGRGGRAARDEPFDATRPDAHVRHTEAEGLLKTRPRIHRFGDDAGAEAPFTMRSNSARNLRPSGPFGMTPCAPATLASSRSFHSSSEEWRI